MNKSYKMRMYQRQLWYNRTRIIGIMTGATLWAIVTILGIGTLI